MTLRKVTSQTHAWTSQPRTLGESPPAPMGATPEQDEILQAEQALAAAFDLARRDGAEQGMRDAAAEIAERVRAALSPLQADLAAQQDRLERDQRELVNSLATLGQLAQSQATASESLALEVAYAAVLRLFGQQEGTHTALQLLCRTLVDEYARPGAVLSISAADAERLPSADPLWQVDPSLTAGQVRLHTDRGDFQTSLEARLDAMRDAFLLGLATHRSSKGEEE